MLRALALAVGLLGAGGAFAQQLDRGTVISPILVIDFERLYIESALGQQVEEELNDKRRELAFEQRAIEAELEAEEKALTERRATLTPEEFRPLADAFDKKVQEIRRDRTAKIRELDLQLGKDRDMFVQAAKPVLERMMIESGAAVVLELRATFLSVNSIDITDQAIQRLDGRLDERKDR